MRRWKLDLLMRLSEGLRFRRVAAVGYKPEELDESGLGYVWLDEMARWLRSNGMAEGLSDMERGSGVYWAKALLDAGTPVTAHLEAWKQPVAWPEDERKAYRGILDYVTDVVVHGRSRSLGETGGRWIRNKAMVGASDLLLVVGSGGLLDKTVDHAAEVGIPWLRYDPFTNVVSGSKHFEGVTM